MAKHKRLELRFDSVSPVETEAIARYEMLANRNGITVAQQVKQSMIMLSLAAVELECMEVAGLQRQIARALSNGMALGANVQPLSYHRPETEVEPSNGGFSPIEL